MSSASDTHVDATATALRQRKLDEMLRAAGLHFEGKAYPVSLQPRILEADVAHAVSAAAKSLHRLVERAAELYWEDERVRRLFPAYRHAERWLLSPPAFRPVVQICRFDGTLADDGHYKIFETGTASPGGIIQNGIAGRLWLEAARAFGAYEELTPGPQPLVDNPHLFVEQLLRAHEDQFGHAPETAAVVNLNGRFTNEVDWMVRGLLDLGVEAELVDAAAFEIEGPTLRTPSGRPVTLTYNKAEQIELISDPGAAPYLDVAARNEICFVNPLISHTVLEDKAILALLGDPRFSDAFTGDERRLIARHVPWTRVFEATTTTDPEGARVSLPEFVLSQREQLVLKPVNLTRGEGVVVGARVPDEEWRAALTAALAGGYVVQQHVPLPQIDVPHPETGTPVSMVHGLDAYVFRGRCVGFQCRASLDAVVNIGKRGTLLPVVVQGSGAGARG